VKSTDAECAKESEESIKDEQRRTKDDRDQRTMNPPSEWLICRPEVEAEPKSETVQKNPV